MSLHHGGGWQPPQTVSHIHIEYIQSVLAHAYSAHKHTVAALHSHGPGFGPSGSRVESKSCHYIMVVADSHLKLVPTSILNIYRLLPYGYSCLEGCF